MSDYASTFAELIRVPFQHIDLVWGIVPLYFGLLLNELTPSKANFRTAVQTGFSFLWAGAHWAYSFYATRPASPPQGGSPPVNLFVTAVVILLGIFALVSGMRRRFPKGLRFLGHTRFANYFMITIFPMQSEFLPWTWPRVIAIGLFAIPAWIALHFGLMPLRSGK